ncbi:transcriptional regulator, partial [Herbaspirillum sp. HC18]
RAPDESSRRFWAVAIGVILEGYAMGRSPEELCAEMLRVLGEQAKSTGETARLRLVDDASDSDEEGKP